MHPFKRVLNDIFLSFMPKSVVARGGSNNFMASPASLIHMTHIFLDQNSN